MSRIEKINKSSEFLRKVLPSLLMTLLLVEKCMKHPVWFERGEIKYFNHL